MSALLWATSALAALQTGEDPQTGLRFWDLRTDGIRYRLAQRLPDQTRAFFLARGFDDASADRFARNCVFQSLFKNTAAGGSVKYDQNTWTVRSATRQGPPLTREYWATIWAQAGLPTAARIAFEWGLLPTTQEYLPGDYNWGMTSYGLPPGTRFDLQIHWEHAGKPHQAWIRDIQCAPDIHPEPAS